MGKGHKTNRIMIEVNYTCDGGSMCMQTTYYIPLLANINRGGEKLADPLGSSNSYLHCRYSRIMIWYLIV